MAKHTRLWNETTYRKYIREGRGQGSLQSYRPWITIQDFPSRGMVSRVKGATTGRIHHFVSNNELNLFYLLDWSDEILDIREQFPLLDLQHVIEIADKAQIRYPYDTRSGFPYVLTSDFFLETVRGFEVITVKETPDLKRPRVREKLEIERRYWQEKSIKWRIVTEKEINVIKAKNIEWLSQAKDLDYFDIPNESKGLCIEYFMSQFLVLQVPLGDLFHDVEQRFHLKQGVGLNIYKYLVYSKQIQADISKTINLSEFRG